MQTALCLYACSPCPNVGSPCSYSDSPLFVCMQPLFICRQPLFIFRQPPACTPSIRRQRLFVCRQLPVCTQTAPVHMLATSVNRSAAPCSYTGSPCSYTAKGQGKDQSYSKQHVGRSEGVGEQMLLIGGSRNRKKGQDCNCWSCKLYGAWPILEGNVCHFSEVEKNGVSCLS